MKIGKENILIICLLVALAVVSWIAFQPKPAPVDNSLLKHDLERLQNENNALKNDIALRDKKIAVFTTKIDSLQNLKPKIHTIYVEKYKAIDRANVVSNDSLLRASLGLGR